MTSGAKIAGAAIGIGALVLWYERAARAASVRGTGGAPPVDPGRPAPIMQPPPPPPPFYSPAPIASQPSIPDPISSSSSASASSSPFTPIAPIAPPPFYSISSRPPAPSGPSKGIMYSTESWRLVLIPLVAVAGIPLEYALRHIEVESDGNPCAVGNPFASYDGGVHPREAGIAQLYGPDDYATTKTDPTALRAYCAPKYMGTYKDASGVAHQAMAFSQMCSRALTAEEMLAQANSLVALIVASRHRADHLLMSVGATWPTTSSDYWKFVKLQHGIPGLANAIVYTKDVLGRAPRSWSEFASTVTEPATLALIKAHDPQTFAYAESFAKVLANAEKTGGVVVGPSIA